MHVDQNPLQFFTAVCYDWLKLLETNEAKQIITEALTKRVKKAQIKVCAFVIMPNHIHIIWRIQNGFKLEEVQRDFLKFTAKELMSMLREQKGEDALEEIYVGLKDRKYQVWKRNSMSIDLVHEWFFKQKFDYLHENPCQPHWQLAELPEDYKYSSARFYEDGVDEFGFLTHHSEI
ncbi:MAG: transposase [Bacteroidetes bacterium]|nr:transposase [Bacteroidota bacterium]MBS1539105.1 transposase [Bacteroidota bacterium]